MALLAEQVPAPGRRRTSSLPCARRRKGCSGEACAAMRLLLRPRVDDTELVRLAAAAVLNSQTGDAAMRCRLQETQDETEIVHEQVVGWSTEEMSKQLAEVAALEAAWRSSFDLAGQARFAKQIDERTLRAAALYMAYREMEVSLLLR
mmetsp:Transcript_124506/g.244208  ORF Transcript_124506/g.244208 Transcript_124506/m.244208 type:complete len:148 (-) Transcript_124506:82-525(-)